MGSGDEKCTQKLSICALGVGLGVSWGFGIFVLGVLAWLCGYGVGMVDAFAHIYLGYAANPLGIIIGTIWGLVDGFIGGVIIAWIYNLAIKCHHCKWCCGKKE